jgi:hypothetical protein
MTSIITPGSKCLLDGKTEVIVLKPSTRSNLSYTVEVPGKSIELVSRDRLSAFAETPKRGNMEEIFEYDE